MNVLPKGNSLIRNVRLTYQSVGELRWYSYHNLRERMMYFHHPYGRLWYYRLPLARNLRLHLIGAYIGLYMGFRLQCVVCIPDFHHILIYILFWQLYQPRQHKLVNLLLYKIGQLHNGYLRRHLLFRHYLSIRLLRSRNLVGIASHWH